MMTGGVRVVEREERVGDGKVSLPVPYSCTPDRITHIFVFERRRGRGRRRGTGGEGRNARGGRGRRGRDMNIELWNGWESCKWKDK